MLGCVGCEGALEQESWAAVAVNHDSQHLVDDWAERAAQIKAASSKKGQPTTNGIGSPAGERVVYYCVGLLLPTDLHAEPDTSAVSQGTDGQIIRTDIEACHWPSFGSVKHLWSL